VGAGRPPPLGLGPRAVDPDGLESADAALPDGGHVGLERERHRETVVVGAGVGDALPWRHLDARVGLVTLGAET
jgi:hypothetical protein